MALIKCPECGREVSNQAAVCIHCGYPLKANPTTATATTNSNTIGSFMVRINNAPSKLKAISVVREVTGLGLAEAKKIVESPNPIVVSNVDINIAQNIANQLLKGGIDSLVIGTDGSVSNVKVNKTPCCLFL